MWMLCCCCSICFCNWIGIIILLPFLTMPSIITNLFLIGQYASHHNPLLPYCGVSPALYLTISSCRCASSCVAACMSSMNVYTDMVTELLIAFTFILTPAISWSLFSAWLIQDNQSMVYKSGLVLYMMCTLNWCIHSIMYGNCWDNMITSLLSIATNG